MAFTCGFFNSENGDRKYNAEQMSSIFDGIIADGVFTTIGDHLAVSAGTGMQVLVGTGKAWFDHTWNVNDAAYPLAIAASDVTLSRIDAIVLETNHSDSVRLNKLRVVQGTVASSPAKPTLTNSEKVHQHPLAWVTVAPGVTQIAASAIENAVGTSACPFVTGIIETTSIDDLFNQWNGEFDEWFDNLKAQLSDNVVANLQRQIDECKKGLTAAGTIVDDIVAEVLQIDPGSNVDDALLALSLPSGKYAVSVTLLTPGGKPFPNLTISGLVTQTGGEVKTNEQGKAFGFCTSSPISLSANTAKYIDIGSNTTKSVNLISGIVNRVTIQATRVSDPKKVFTSSTTSYFSADVIEYDWSAVGGGTNGGTGYPSGGQVSTSIQAHGGSGGYGGGVLNQANNKYSPETPIKIIVGGVGGESSVDNVSTSSASRTPGGGGATAQAEQLGNGSTWKTDAGNGRNGPDFLYPPLNVGGSGGGGGSHAKGGVGEISASAGSGGNGGGRGSNSPNSAGSNASSYGGGGGGGYAFYSTDYDDNNVYTDGGTGMQGCVGMVWRYAA